MVFVIGHQVAFGLVVAGPDRKVPRLLLAWVHILVH